MFSVSVLMGENEREKGKNNNVYTLLIIFNLIEKQLAIFMQS